MMDALFGYAVGLPMGFFCGWFIAKSFFLKRTLFLCSQCGDSK